MATHVNISVFRLEVRYASHLISRPARTQKRNVSTSGFSGPGFQPRNLPILYDFCSSTNSISLDKVISEFLHHWGVIKRNDFRDRGFRKVMPFGHHLVYFPPDTPLRDLSADGTISAHSPGPPFTCQLWAGGEIKANGLIALRGAHHYCLERVTDVKVKGPPGNERAIVKICRHISHGYDTHRQEDRPDYCPLEETRTLVFIRDRATRAAVPEIYEQGVTKHEQDRSSFENPDVSKPLFSDLANSEAKSSTFDFSFSMVPSAALLFRFSTLTQNHHRVHYDKQYCQEVEGYRGLLVHGPLSLLLMLETLRKYVLSKSTKNYLTNLQEIERPVRMSYSHISPLFAEEQMVVRGQQIREKIWNTWIEGPDGRLAVKARIETNDIESIKAATASAIERVRRRKWKFYTVMRPISITKNEGHFSQSKDNATKIEYEESENTPFTKYEASTSPAQGEDKINDRNLANDQEISGDKLRRVDEVSATAGGADLQVNAATNTGKSSTKQEAKYSKAAKDSKAFENAFAEGLYA